MNFQEWLSEGKLSTKLPSENPEKKEGFYILDTDGGEVVYGPFELSPKGFKLAKSNVSSGQRVVAAVRDIKTNEMKWNLVHTDGGMK